MNCHHQPVMHKYKMIRRQQQKYIEHIDLHFLYHALYTIMQWVKAMQKHIVRSKLSTNDGRACSERERVKRINECKIAESGIINYVQGDTKIVLDNNTAN